MYFGFWIRRKVKYSFRIAMSLTIFIFFDAENVQLIGQLFCNIGGQMRKTTELIILVVNRFSGITRI